MADIEKEKDKLPEQPAVAKDTKADEIKKTKESQAKSGVVEIVKDEAGNVSIHNPESDKAAVLFPSRDHVKK